MGKRQRFSAGRMSTPGGVAPSMLASIPLQGGIAGIVSLLVGLLMLAAHVAMIV